SVDRSGVWANGLYQGRLLSGDAAAGSAKLELPDGRIYEGELRDYDMNGSAVITYPNGDVYQ
ncbi:MAG: 2-isopropylmalate synthase, partial [Calditrichaeota bacterium]|nr:2-isopropylmalate synthase [Calditrichota bacterium]